MSDILKRLTGESALPVYSNIEKFKRGKDGAYFVAEDFNETVKKRELVNAKERLRVSETALCEPRAQAPSTNICWQKSFPSPVKL